MRDLYCPVAYLQEISVLVQMFYCRVVAVCQHKEKKYLSVHTFLVSLFYAFDEIYFNATMHILMCSFPLSGCSQLSLATQIASINWEVIKVGIVVVCVFYISLQQMFSYLALAPVPISWGFSSHCTFSHTMQHITKYWNRGISSRTLWTHPTDLGSFAAIMAYKYV